ncbi:MAG: polysaccharide pyruvyl transferase family protein [Pseudomonadota bacterium]
MPAASDTPLILFGAFDRHNFGDLLLAHVAARRHAGRPLLFAGVAARDLRPWGGHAVHGLAQLARDWQDTWGDAPADLLHVGGEVLTCTLYEAAVMVLEREAADAAIARYDRDPAARQAWAETQLGLRQRLAYLADQALFRHPGRFACQAVGGVDLAGLPAPAQDEVRARLQAADALSVRDRVTQARLAEWGIAAALEADPGEQVAQMFGEEIARHAAGPALAEVRQAFPQGYVAVQFSADFGDDATLKALAGELDRFCTGSGLGLCLFRAGAAPWHDDLAVYRRLAGFMTTCAVHRFESLHLWDICALLAHSRLYCGSSLHGRIVARAFGVPGVSLLRQPLARMGKVRAYAQSWWPGEDATLATPETAGDALAAALAH